VFVHRDGRFYPVAFTASPLREGGTPIGTVVEVRDMTAEKRDAEALAERARTALLGADVGLALTQGADARGMLRLCAEAVVRHLDAAFARIWTLDEREQVLELQASAGMYTHTDGPHGRVPVGRFKIGLIAAERKPHLTNSVVGDPRVGDQDWARREGMVAFAGYPLVVDDRLVGVMAMFARRQLSDAALQALGSVAREVGLGIARKRAEAERERLQREVIEAQESLLAELSTPLVPVKDGIVVMPLIGAMNPNRAAQMLEALLAGVTARGARVAIIDVTGVRELDTHIAHMLVRAAQSVRLLGSEAVITGIRAGVAQVLVGLGVEMRDVVTRRNLQGGIEYAERLIGGGAPRQVEARTRA
jgi:anti-anti-sigma regulatory factor